MFVLHEFLNGGDGGAGSVGDFDDCFVDHVDVGCFAVFGGFEKEGWDFGGYVESLLWSLCC